MTEPKKTHGGAREGAGRKPRGPNVLAQALCTDDPKEFLRSVMQDEAADGKLRVDAAKALLPFEHRKPGEGKEKPGGNVTKFTPKAPPKLVANSR